MILDIMYLLLDHIFDMLDPFLDQLSTIPTIVTSVWSFALPYLSLGADLVKFLLPAFVVRRIIPVVIFLESVYWFIQLIFGFVKLVKKLPFL